MNSKVFGFIFPIKLIRESSTTITVISDFMAFQLVFFTSKSMFTSSLGE